MTPTIIAFVIIIAYFSAESFLRYGEEAKSIIPAESDKKSTSYIIRAFQLNILCLFASFLLNHYKLGTLFSQSFLAFFGNAFMIIGLMIRIIATGTLREYYTRTLKIITHQKIVDKGLYRYIRHPGYAGVILLWSGAGWASNNYWILLLILLITLVTYHYRIRNEEQMLLNAFGEDYVKYQKRTWRLLPYIY